MKEDYIAVPAKRGQLSWSV